MGKLRIILNDQLSGSISSLDGCDLQQDLIMMCEILNEAVYVKHHKKKIAFLFSAMRHFAQELIQKGYNVKYIKLNDPENTGSFKGEIKKILKQYSLTCIIITHPSEYRLLKEIEEWQYECKIPVEIREDNRFLCSIKEFSEWAKNKKQLRMEYFYRKIRIKHNILMQDNKPLSGRWNYDLENRHILKTTVEIPQPYMNYIDYITQEVIDLVSQKFQDHFGDLQPFYFSVTRQDALKALNLFINQRLPLFGKYQDTMLQGQPWMYHSVISFYLNCGLLLPLECVLAAELAFKQGKAPLNSVEGFIRQIIGWREYTRGIYWLKMPEYKKANFFEAKRKLPDFYWTANTKMNCISQCVLETKKNAYAHHIQRLMILGNFALLIGINPKYVNEWFLIVYADAFEWVELPNVSGMALFADGGYLSSKPYAAGGNYINKMSDYCNSCYYKVDKKNEPEACPFNYLYWNFLEQNKEKLKYNHRLKIAYNALQKMTEKQKKFIFSDSNAFLKKIENNNLV